MKSDGQPVRAPNKRVRHGLRLLRRTLAAIPQNIFLWLGSLVVPTLSRAGEHRLARFISWLLCRPCFRWCRCARTNLDIVYGDTKTPEEKSRILRASFDNAALVVTDYFWFGRRTEERLERHCAVGDDTIRRWIEGLPYSFDVTDGEKHYMLAHAYPYYYDREPNPRLERYRRSDAVWRRLILREDPFAEYRGEKHYHCLICGHTITDYYFVRMKADKTWPFRKPRATKRNRIFYGEKFVDLDCGAKLLSCGEDESPQLRKAAERAQLACLRLEDAEEFYVR